MDYSKELKKYSTTLISDVLDIYWLNSWLLWIKPQSKNYNISWEVFTVKYVLLEKNVSPTKAWDYIDDIDEWKVILIDNGGLLNCTVWWDILTKMAKIKWLAGTIINWCCRDIESINKLNYPVFSKWVYMQSWKWRVMFKSTNSCITINWVNIFPWDYVRWDLNWVVVIPKKIILEVLKKAKTISSIESNIRKTISNWLSLKEAREKFNYNFHIWKKI